jgi:hypothetical protein
MQEAGGGLTDTATVSVTVSGVNDPPDAVDDNATTTEETPVQIFVLNNDSDPEGHSLSLDAVGLPANGTASVITETAVYTPAASFVGTDVFTYTVSDGNGGFSQATITVIVENTPPTLSNVAIDPLSIDENDTATLTGDMSDQGQTGFTLEVDWGDGTPLETFTYIAGTTSFTETHQYLDDNPTGTTSDLNTIEVTLKDDDGGSDTVTTTITVNNLDPGLSNVAIAPSPADEGATTTLSGDIADTGTQDDFTLEVLWGDGSSDTYLYSPGTTSFNETHAYPDNDTYTATLTLTDDDMGSVVDSVSVSITNVAPTLSGVSATTVDENSATTLSGSINDPGSGDSFTLEVGWGDGMTDTFAYNAGTPSFNETHQYLDDDPTLTPSDVYTVTLTLTDDDGGSDNTTTNLTVNNIAPTVNAGPDQTVSKGSPTVSFNGSFTDPGTLDSHTIEWDFGDGNTITGTLTPSHTYPATAAVYTVTLTVTDDDTGVGSDTLTVTVTNSPPTAVDDTYTTPEDTPLSVPAATGLLANDTDPDGDTLTASLDVTPLNGTVTVNADGSFVYTPTLDFNGSDNFTYIVSDSDGLTDTAIVVINVTGENDAPVAIDDTATTVQNTAVTIAVLDNDSDPENDPLTVTAVGTPANGSATTDGTTAQYTPAAGFTGSDVFTYTISDGNGGNDTASVTVTVVEELKVYLPVVVNNFVAAAPDLVVTNVRGSSDNIEVTVRNQGNAPVVDAFWVDFYIDPSPVPSSANELWQDVSSEGIVWGVTAPLAVGEELTLVYSTEPGAPNLYYAPDFSFYTGSLPAGTPIYAQVDSAHISTTYGAVLENHEITGGPYNNVSDPATATARIEGLSTPDTTGTPAPSSDLILPPRPDLGHSGQEN